MATAFKEQGGSDLGRVALARYSDGSGTHYGEVLNGKVFRIEGDIFGDWTTTEESAALDSVTLLAPVEPRRIVGIGVNSEVYRAYRQEGGDKSEATSGVYSLKKPVTFGKYPHTVCGPNENIIVPEGNIGVSGSAELGVVIGKRLEGVTPDNAMDFVLGFTCTFDCMSPEVSIAAGDDLTQEYPSSKNFPTFCPIGPWVVSGIDVEDIKVSLELNGKRFQEGSTAEFTYDVPHFLAMLAKTTVLEPGDVVLMGALGIEGIVDGKEVGQINRFSGLRKTRSKPYPKYEPGDQLSINIEHIGSLEIGVANAD